VENENEKNNENSDMGEHKVLKNFALKIFFMPILQLQRRRKKLLKSSENGPSAISPKIENGKKV